MFSQVLSSTIGSLTPLWSNSIVKNFELGVEYNIAINMILAEIVKFSTSYITDTISIIFVLIMASLLIIKKYSLINMSYFKFYNKNAVTLMYQDGENTKISDEFRAINDLLIEKYNVNKIRYVGNNKMNINVVVDSVDDIKLENNIVASVKNEDNTTSIILKSTNKHTDIKKFIRDATNIYTNNTKHKMVLIGNEVNNKYQYPEIMIHLTYVITKKYNTNNLLVMTNLNNSTNCDNDRKENEKNENAKEDYIERDTKKNDIYLLGSCKDVHLIDDIYITIERYNDIVKYILSATTTDIALFVNNASELYNELRAYESYKYHIRMTGSDYIYYDDRYANIIKYPESMIAVSHNLITIHNINKYRLIDLHGKQKKIICDIDYIKINEMVFKIISNVKTSHWNRKTEITYTIESNTVDVGEYVKKCIAEYNDYVNNEKAETLYYFKYIGICNGTLNFKHRILCNKDESCESFDNIFNEHTNMLKNDIDQLNNKNYYKKTGIRRKKAYLFYGEPGCGKNACVNAMAYYGKRHIIDISFANIKTNSEFIDIMSLSEINGISFNRNEIIFMFDEMDIGLESIGKEAPKEKNFTIVIDKDDDEDDKSSNFTKLDSYDKLSYGCILSQLDGTGTCEGVIYVGMTNNIKKIPVALKRSMRLTPIHFKNLRKCDVISIIENNFEFKIPKELHQHIPDGIINAAKLRASCEKYTSLRQTDLPIFLNELRQNVSECDYDDE